MKTIDRIGDRQGKESRTPAYCPEYQFPVMESFLPYDPQNKKRFEERTQVIEAKLKRVLLRLNVFLEECLYSLVISLGRIDGTEDPAVSADKQFVIHFRDEINGKIRIVSGGVV